MKKETQTKKDHWGPLKDRVGSYDVIDCRVCGFIHVLPLPSALELQKLYKESFYSHEKPLYFKDMAEDLDWWNIHYRNHFGLFEKQVKGRKVLDIGSGPGHFLVCGKKLGWDVLGFEPSKQAARYARNMGVRVINDIFTAKRAARYGPFDVVYLYLVMEHIPHPIEFLKEVKKVVREGGIICVVSPNDYNPLQAILRDNLEYKPWWVAPPQHLNYFTFSSIKKLMQNQGLSIQEELGSFPMEFFLLSGLRYVGNRKIGRACHMRRKEFEINMSHYAPSKLNAFYKGLAKQGIGREFIIIAKKLNNLKQ